MINELCIFFVFGKIAIVININADKIASVDAFGKADTSGLAMTY